MNFVCSTQIACELQTLVMISKAIQYLPFCNRVDLNLQHEIAQIKKVQSVLVTKVKVALGKQNHAYNTYLDAVQSAVFSSVFEQKISHRDNKNDPMSVVFYTYCMLTDANQNTPQMIPLNNIRLHLFRSLMRVTKSGRLRTALHTFRTSMRTTWWNNICSQSRNMNRNKYIALALNISNIYNNPNVSPKYQNIIKDVQTKQNSITKLNGSKLSTQIFKKVLKKISKRTSKRKTSKRKTSKRKASKRKTSKRKTSKRTPLKRRSSKKRTKKTSKTRQSPKKRSKKTSKTRQSAKKRSRKASKTRQSPKKRSRKTSKTR